MVSTVPVPSLLTNLRFTYIQRLWVYISWRFVSSQTVCKKKYAFCAWLFTIRIVVFMPSSLFYWHWFALSSVFHHATTLEWWASFTMFHVRISISLSSSFLSKLSRWKSHFRSQTRPIWVTKWSFGWVRQFWQNAGAKRYGKSGVKLLCNNYSSCP